MFYIANEGISGSPPHVRVIPQYDIAKTAVTRITPACAGNTIFSN